MLKRDGEHIKKAEHLWKILSNADSVMIGAGAGLSVSAGYEYDGQRFQKYFSDFEEKYHFRDMYAGGFYPYETQEELWAYWSRYIWVNRYTDAEIPVYEQLLSIVKDKDYFVLTTNVDHCFQKAGFQKHRLFYTQGDYGLFQCSQPCCRKTYDNKSAVRQMVERQKDRKIPSELVPCCPVCKKPMCMNLRSDDAFVQDDGWYQAADRYQEYVCRHKNMPVVYLELGVGMNTPGIIKYNFWNQVSENVDASYICINLGQSYAPKEIKSRSICINDDIGQVLKELLAVKSTG